jgi:hypothetical protein
MKKRVSFKREMFLAKRLFSSNSYQKLLPSTPVYFLPGSKTLPPKVICPVTFLKDKNEKLTDVRMHLREFLISAGTASISFGGLYNLSGMWTLPTFCLFCVSACFTIGTFKETLNSKIRQGGNIDKFIRSLSVNDKETVIRYLPVFKTHLPKEDFQHLAMLCRLR